MKPRTKLQVEVMKKWYEDWAKAVEEGNGELTEKEIEGFGERWDKMVADGIKKRDEIANVTGYTGSDSSKSQEATRRSYETMSQDTGNEINGRLTAVQQSGEEIKQLAGVIQLDVSELRKIGMSANEALMDLRDIGLDAVFYLEKISKNTAQLYIMNEKLDKVVKNTEV